MVKKLKVKLKAQSKANSNENSQNPKENQEKTAEKGSQEHSEHTAENKQPESKDNAQKKDESTCLCKFFKKIAEWICARKNKNSKKADENATENNAYYTVSGVRWGIGESRGIIRFFGKTED